MLTHLKKWLPARAPRRIGLALSGGAALGGVHVGVLRAIAERGIPVAMVSGTSIGAYVAALFAFGRDWREIRDIVKEMTWMSVSSFSLSQYGLMANTKLRASLEAALGEVCFADAELSLAVVAVDLSRNEKVVFREGPVGLAVQASTCLPGIFVPVESEGRFLVDGGILENVPVSPLQAMGADCIIAVELAVPVIHGRPGNIADVVVKSLNLAFQSATELQAREAEVRIRPDLSGYSLIDTDQTPELIEVGYAAAMAAFDQSRRLRSIGG